MTALEKYVKSYEEGEKEISEKISEAYIPQIRYLAPLNEGIKAALQAAMRMYYREMKEMVKRIDEQFELDKADEQFVKQ